MKRSCNLSELMRPTDRTVRTIVRSVLSIFSSFELANESFFQQGRLQENFSFQQKSCAALFHLSGGIFRPQPLVGKKGQPYPC